MKLEEYLRTILNNKIIPLIRKDKCEICENTKKLEVHHLKLFKDILEETLQDLNLIYKDTKEYSKKELDLIVNVILGKHVNIEYLTLCEDCHTLIHEDTWKELCVNDKHKQYYNKLKFIKEVQEKEYIKNILIPYLNSIVGVEIFKEDQYILVNKINARDSKCRLKKSISQLNNYFKNNKIPYIIISKRDNRRKIDNKTKENKNREKCYWILIKDV